VKTDSTLCAQGDVPCSPCIARLSSPTDRISAMREAIACEPEPLVTLTHLLHLCRDDHRTLWERADSEVAAMHEVPLAELATWSTHHHAPHHHRQAEAAGGADLGALGRMTETVIDQLLGILTTGGPGPVP
jgi:hypothetical protein